MNKKPVLSELSVFFPAYNEEKNIRQTVETAVAVLAKIASQWEIIIVDDGSKDRTGEIVRRLIAKDKRIRLITHSPNRGYGGALKTGLAACRYQWIAYTDSDGQFDFREVTRFFPYLQQADLIIGYRQKRTDSSYRIFLQKILFLANWFLFGLKVRDVDCGFKLFKKAVVDRVGPLKTESAITETEFIVRARRLGFKIVEVGVTHHSRLEGTQTGGKFKIIFRAAWQGLQLCWLLFTEEKK